MNFLWFIVYVFFTPFVLYFSAKMVVYGALSAKSLFERRQQERRELELSDHKPKG